MHMYTPTYVRMFVCTDVHLSIKLTNNIETDTHNAYHCCTQKMWLGGAN